MITTVSHDQVSTQIDFSSLRGDLNVKDDPSRVPMALPKLYYKAGYKSLRIARNSLLRKPVKRDSNFITSLYEKEWGKSNAQYAEIRDETRSIFRVGHGLVYTDGWFIIKRYKDLFLNAINQIKAESVLEVGSGRGKNLALLALNRPDLQLTGIELTHNGVDHSRRLAENLPPQFVRAAGYDAISEKQKAAIAQMKFSQGSALQMPFKDKSFDFSFTCLVLEQLRRDYGQVAREMSRVTRKYCAFIEAFDEANSWLGRANLHSYDYFNASYKEFANYGLEPVYFTTAMPHKLTFRTGLLIARVVS